MPTATIKRTAGIADNFIPSNDIEPCSCSTIMHNVRTTRNAAHRFSNRMETTTNTAPRAQSNANAKAGLKPRYCSQKRKGMPVKIILVFMEIE